MCTLINEIIFILISLILSYSDFKTYHIPLIPLYLGIISYILISIIFYREIIVNHLIGMILMGVFFFLMRVLTKGGMGLGDIQYALYCGLISGVPYFIYASLISSVIGIIMYFVFYSKSKKIPLIPAMMLGTVFMIVIVN